jgi:hypothetical protein
MWAEDGRKLLYSHSGTQVNEGSAIFRRRLPRYHSIFHVAMKRTFKKVLGGSWAGSQVWYTSAHIPST